MDQKREMVLAAFDEALGEDFGATFREMFPRHRWRDAIPADVWEEPGVKRQFIEGRDHLHERLAETLGREVADAAMEYLPPVPYRVLRSRGLAHLIY